MSDKFKKISDVQPAVTVGEKDYLVGTLENGQTFKINAKDVALALMKFMPVADKDKDGLKSKNDFYSRWDTESDYLNNVEDIELPGIYYTDNDTLNTPESSLAHIFVFGDFRQMLMVYYTASNRYFINRKRYGNIGIWIELK